MEIVGYCTIRKNATTCTGTDHPEKYIGKDCRVMEFDQWGGVLVLDSGATGLAMFDKEDVIRKFECREQGEFIFPPDLDMIGQMAHMHKLMYRKGGWNPVLKGMVIQYGLMKGKYNDDFLFQKEREENFQRSKLSATELKIMDLEEELKKHTNPPPYYYKRRSNPRRLRRLLRRLRSNKDAPAMASSLLEWNRLKRMK